MRDSQLMVEALRLAERNGWQAHMMEQPSTILLKGPWMSWVIQAPAKDMLTHVQRCRSPERWGYGPTTLREVARHGPGEQRVLQIKFQNEELSFTRWYPNEVCWTRICLVGGAAFTAEALENEVKIQGMSFARLKDGWIAGHAEEWSKYEAWVRTLEPGPPDLPEAPAAPPRAPRARQQTVPVEEDVVDIEKELEGVDVPSFWSRLGS